MSGFSTPPRALVFMAHRCTLVSPIGGDVTGYMRCKHDTVTDSVSKKKGLILLWLTCKCDTVADYILVSLSNGKKKH